MTYKVSAAEKATYASDGVICLRGVIPAQQAGAMLDAVRRFMANDEASRQQGVTVESHSDRGGRYYHANTMSAVDPVFRRFALESILPAVAAQMLDSDEVRFFYDQIILLEAGTRRSTAWHNDLTYWPFEGPDIVSLWVALTPVTQDTAPVEYLAGSHLQGQLYQTAPANDIGARETQSIPICPNYSEPENRQGKRILWWEMEPGDVLVHHPLILHGSAVNTSLDKVRCGLSVRYLGKDVRYSPRPSAPVKRAYNCAIGAYPDDDENLPLIKMASS